MARMGTRLVAAGLAACTMLAQSPGALRIAAREGGGAVVAAGGYSARRYVVAVTGSAGRPATKVTVHFRLPAEGPGGVFASGLRSETALTDEQGLAYVQGIQWNSVPGKARLIAAAGGAEAVFDVEVSAAQARADKAGGRRTSKKWLILAVVGAAAGGGLVAAGRGKSSASAASSTVVTPSIGTPAIVIGRP
jgi:hypothetical protein